jgi:hypothetical protein
MLKKDFINIINEELQKFDFLSNDEYLKEQESVELLLNEDLQKQFICDSLLNRNSKIKIIETIDSRISGNWDEMNFENADVLTIEYFVKIEYKYDVEKEPIIFDLNFYSDEVRIGVSGYHDSGNGIDRAPEGDSWFDSFEWLDINVTLNTVDGDEIKFVAFEKAPPRIKTLFIRGFTERLIEGQTLEIRTREMKDKIQNVPYC